MDHLKQAQPKKVLRPPPGLPIPEHAQSRVLRPPPGLPITEDSQSKMPQLPPGQLPLPPLPIPEHTQAAQFTPDDRKVVTPVSTRPKPMYSVVAGTTPVKETAPAEPGRGKRVTLSIPKRAIGGSVTTKPTKPTQPEQVLPLDDQYKDHRAMDSQCGDQLASGLIAQFGTAEALGLIAKNGVDVAMASQPKPKQGTQDAPGSHVSNVAAKTGKQTEAEFGPKMPATNHVGSLRLAIAAAAQGHLEKSAATKKQVANFLAGKRIMPTATPDMPVREASTAEAPKDNEPVWQTSIKQWYGGSQNSTEEQHGLGFANLEEESVSNYGLFHPMDEISHSQTRSWVSHQERERMRFIKVQANMTYAGFDKSPFVPKTFEEFIGHKNLVATLKKQSIQDKVEMKERLLEDLWQFVYAGGDPNQLLVEFSEKLATATERDEHSDIAWPSYPHFKADGDDRAKGQYRRFLPLPRTEVLDPRYYHLLDGPNPPAVSGPNVPFEMRMVCSFSHNPAFDMTTRSEARGILKNDAPVELRLDEINNMTAQLIAETLPANDGFD